MLDLARVAEHIVEQLQAAGVAATVDNRDLNPPGVYVAAPIVTFDRLAGYTCQFDLYVAVPNAGRSQALAELGPLLLTVRSVWGTDTAYPVDLLVPDQTDPLPAYRIPITVHVGESDG